MLDKMRTYQLLPQEHRVSILNWGTPWEVRRYAQLADLAETAALGGDDVAFDQWDTTEVHDQIDLYCQVGFTAEPLQLQHEQFLKRCSQGMQTHTWKHIFGSARGYIQAGIGAKLVHAVFQGPIENLLIDHKKFTLSLKSEIAQGQLEFETDGKSYGSVKLSFKSQEPSGVIMLVEDLPSQGWKQMTPPFQDFNELHEFEFRILGEDHRDEMSWAAVCAIDILQMLAQLHDSKVKWSFRGKINKFDLAFIDARSAKLCSDFAGHEFLDNLEVVSA
jgi:hypothetical protein